jgi:predicted phosphodiesterase
MKYAIIADIHSNLAALKVVLEDIKSQRCTHTICLGDIVGYYSYPKECVDLIRTMNIPSVKGNHDDYCSTDGPLDGFNQAAAEAVRWTREQLTEDDRRWLHSLPLTMVVSGFTLVHATLEGPERWGYVFDKLAAAAHFEHQTTQVCFFGHTHVPAAFIRNNVTRGGTFSSFKIEPKKKYFINVGSVGQPRDNNLKAAYVTYDMDKQIIELRRLAYPMPPGEGGANSPFKLGPRGGPQFLSVAKQIEKEYSLSASDTSAIVCSHY